MSADESRRSNRLAASAASQKSSMQNDCDVSESSSVIGIGARKTRGRKRKMIVIEDDESDTSNNQNDSETYSDSSDDEKVKKCIAKGERSAVKGQGKGNAKRRKSSKETKTKSKSPSKSTARSLSKKYGPESERTCPYCNKVFSIVLGLAYHLERRVCQKEVIDVNTDGNEPQLVPKLHCKLFPGEKFVTSYGVVQVVADDRATDSPVLETSVPPVPEKRKDSIQRRKNTIYLACAKHQRRRRHKFMQLVNENVTGEKLQAEIWKEYCPSTTPAAILSSNWSSKATIAFPKNEKEDVRAQRVDSAGDRIVQCVLIRDERRKVTDIDIDVRDESRLTKLDLAKAAVKKAKKVALQIILNNSHGITSTTGAIHESGMKLYLPRRLLDERYNDKIPFYECIRCGHQFSSHAGLKGHLNVKVCEKKVDQLKKDRLERLETIEKGLDEAHLNAPLREYKNQPGATVVVGDRKIKASVFKKLPGWIVFKHSRSSLYPEVFERLKFKRGSNNSKFLQKKWEAIGPGRQRVRNRKRKGRRPTEESEDVETSQKRTRKGPCDTSEDEGNDSDSEDYTDYSAASYEFLNNAGAHFVDLVSEKESELQMPQRPTPTYQIPNAFEIPIQLSTNAEASTHSNLVFKNTDHQMVPSKTRTSKTAIIKVKDPTKPRPKTISTSSAAGKSKASKSSNASSEKSTNSLIEILKAPTITCVEISETTAKVSPGKPKASTTISSNATKSERSSSSIIVDPSVFVEEIQAGRYPSIKVYNGEHMNYCLICKEKVGQLFNCEFCPNAEHIDCVKKRVNIRDFDRDDDEFMCHKCIQIIISRRARAQKRRLQKLDERLGTTNEENSIALSSELLPPLVDKTVETQTVSETLIPLMNSAMTPSTTSDLPTLDDNIGTSKLYTCPNGGPGGLICCDLCTASFSKLLSQTEQEREIQMVSKIGQEVSELMELLTDAQIRLQQALDASKGNDKRRKLLSSSNGIGGSNLETFGNIWISSHENVLSKHHSSLVDQSRLEGSLNRHNSE